jgi:hypothetical protein
MPTVPVAIETGEKKTFAVACDWPGWCRSGRDEDAALQALLDAGPRYAVVMDGTRAFTPPRSIERLEIVERLPGDATTDFGAPGALGTFDRIDVDARQLARLEAIVRACWAALDRAAADAKGVRLATGPRGGGRSLAKIREHVSGATEGYLRVLGGTPPKGGGDDATVRQAFIEALTARARGELPGVGPRGESRWPARYGARREAWHVLDHAWEIEDRAR